MPINKQQKINNQILKIEFGNGTVHFEYNSILFKSCSTRQQAILNLIKELELACNLQPLVKNKQTNKKSKIDDIKYNLIPIQDPNVLHMAVKPEENESYYWINKNENPEIRKYIWGNEPCDLTKFSNHNCYTKENADIALSMIKAKVELQNIATELNAGRLIDWSSMNQLKYTIYFSHLHRKIDWSGYYFNHYADIACLNRSFPEIALEKMGEAKLKLALGIWK